MNREVKIKNMKLAALNNAVYIFGILIIAVFSVMSPYFFTVTNATSILRASTLMLSIGIGMTFALIVGELGFISWEQTVVFQHLYVHF